MAAVFASASFAPLTAGVPWFGWTPSVRAMFVPTHTLERAFFDRIHGRGYAVNALIKKHFI
jgi:hypothetical protein